MSKGMKGLVGLAVALYLLVEGSRDAVRVVQGLEQIRQSVASTVPIHGYFIMTYAVGAAVVQIGLGVGILRNLWDTAGLFSGTTLREWVGFEEAGRTASLYQLREGDVIDYDLRTWTVTDHKEYPYEGWPTDTWTLEADGDKRFLEWDGGAETTVRLYERGAASDVIVEGEPFSGGGGKAPGAIEYPAAERTQYVLAEEDVRVHDVARARTDRVNHINFITRSRSNRVIAGVCGGVAESLDVYPWLLRVGLIVGILNLIIGIGGVEGVQLGCVIILFLVGGYYGLARILPEPPPERLAHYWVYENGEGALVALKCTDRRWEVRAGREVEPHEFDNILPASESEGPW